MKLCEYLDQGREQLMIARTENADPLEHMKQIAQWGLRFNTAQLYSHWNEEISSSMIQEVDKILKRRLNGEPFQYITGHTWFWNSKFEVGIGVLIPRPETELLVETIFKKEPRKKVRIAELGGGSGNIGISVLLECPGWEWHAYEISPGAFSYLKKNRETLLSKSHSYFMHRGDFFKRSKENARYDWIVTNPPYISSEEYPSLSREVRQEPKVALQGGIHGIQFIRRLIETAADLLVDGGQLLIEIGAHQASQVLGHMESYGFQNTEVLQDYSGLPRAVVSRYGCLNH